MPSDLNACRLLALANDYMFYYSCRLLAPTNSGWRSTGLQATFSSKSEKMTFVRGNSIHNRNVIGSCKFNKQSAKHECHITQIVLCFTRQSITYGITKSIHIKIIYNLTVITALISRILWWHRHIVFICITLIKFFITQHTLPYEIM